MLYKSAMGSQTKDNFMYENGYGSQRNRVRIMPKSTSPISGWNGKGNESPKRELKLLSVITVSCASQIPKANEETNKQTNKQKTRHHLRKPSENPNVRQTKLSPQVVNEFIEKSGRTIN